MKKILLILTVLITTSCTPAQVAWHLMIQDRINAEVDPTIKAEMQAEYQFWADSYEAIKAEATAGHPCEQWFDHAMEAGFSVEQWKSPMSRIMSAESGCSPSAYNPSGATGLMQVMKMWADDCGGTPADLFDPVFNINCARHVYLVQGWNAWSTY